MTTLQADGNAVTAGPLQRSFGSRNVLAGAHINIAPGEFVALLGRSGTGKSTLLRVLAGLDHDYEGCVSVPDKVSVVFQGARLLPWLRVLPNVTIGLRRTTTSTRAAASGCRPARCFEFAVGGFRAEKTHSRDCYRIRA